LRFQTTLDLLEYIREEIEQPFPVNSREHAMSGKGFFPTPIPAIGGEQKIHKVGIFTTTRRVPVDSST